MSEPKRGVAYHIHKFRYGIVTPATNKEFWQKKRVGNVERDRRNLRELKKLGWKVFVIWECQTKRREGLIKKIDLFLSC